MGIPLIKGNVRFKPQVNLRHSPLALQPAGHQRGSQALTQWGKTKAPSEGFTL